MGAAIVAMATIENRNCMNQHNKIAFSAILRKSLALVVDNIGLFLQLCIIAVCLGAVVVLFPFLFFGFAGVRSIFDYSAGDIVIRAGAELPSLKLIIMCSLYILFAWSALTVFWAGLTRIAFDLLDHGKSSVRHLWAGDKKIISYIGATIVLTFGTIAGLILGIIPGIYLFICGMFYGQCVIDRNMSAIASIKASFTLTHGHRWQIVCWILLGIILGKFFGMWITPVLVVANVILYRTLSEAKSA